MQKVLFLIFGFLILPCFVFAQAKIEINTASQKELETLTGIGPVYAQRIIENRPFSSINELTKVSGIGEKTLQKIKDQGLAYIDSDTIQAPSTISEKTDDPILSKPLSSDTNETPLKENDYQASIITPAKREITEINLSSEKEKSGFNYSLILTGIIVASISGAIVINIKRKLEEKYDQ